MTQYGLNEHYERRSAQALDAQGLALSVIECAALSNAAFWHGWMVYWRDTFDASDMFVREQEEEIVAELEAEAVDKLTKSSLEAQYSDESFERYQTWTRDYFKLQSKWIKAFLPQEQSA